MKVNKSHLKLYYKFKWWVTGSKLPLDYHQRARFDAWKPHHNWKPFEVEAVLQSSPWMKKVEEGLIANLLLSITLTKCMKIQVSRETKVNKIQLVKTKRDIFYYHKFKLKNPLKRPK